ncbi:MAG TPA: HEAT repeat domain-containing protein [Pyrinomonadaceae bacterium]
MNNFRKWFVLFLISFAILGAGAYAQTANFADSLAKLKDKRAAVRIAAIKSLGRSGDERAIDPLIAVIKNDEDLEVAGEATAALGNFRDLRAVRGVMTAFATANGNAHEAANRALKNWGAFAVPTMIEALSDSDSYASSMLIDAFESMGEPAVDPLIAALVNPDQLTNAAMALGRIKSSRAVSALILLLKDKEAYVRSAATDALGNIGDARAIEPIRPLLKDRDASVRASAVFALGELKDGVSVDEIAALIAGDDNDLKREIGTALSKIGSPRAIEHLMSAARNQDLPVVAGAYKTYLRRLTPALVNTLVDALQEFGDQEMIEAFLNSGNRRLASEARVWAKDNNYEIFSIPTYGTGRRKRRG